MMEKKIILVREDHIKNTYNKTIVKKKHSSLVTY